MLEMLAVIPDTIPTPVALAAALAGIGAGLGWMRAAASDKLAAAQRLSASTAVYFVRAETARNQLRALHEPTQALDLTQLQAATATPGERMAEWAHRQADHIRHLVTPIQNPPDWAEDEMTRAFRDTEPDQAEDQPTAPAAPPVLEPIPQPRRGHPLPTPPSTPAEPLPGAPAATQAPARAMPRQRRTRSLAARSRWDTTLLGLRVPPLKMPSLPQPFQMPRIPSIPQLRAACQLPNDPRRMAMLPPDPMRQWRRPAQAAL